jgi:hypothetical protein
MTELQAPEQVLYDLLAQHPSLGPKQAADALGWTKDQVAQAKEGLKAKGLISTRQGGGMSVAEASAVASAKAEPIGQQANRPISHQAPEPKAYKPLGRKPKGSEAQGQQAQGPQANGQEAPEPRGRKPKTPKPEPNKSLETWIWDAACSIRGAKDAPKYKDYILPPIFTKRLCHVVDDELDLMHMVFVHKLTPRLHFGLMKNCRGSSAEMRHIHSTFEPSIALH